MSTYSKSDLIRAVATEAGLSQATAATAVNATLQAIQAAAQGGRRVTLHRFGVFEMRMRKGRIGRNPATGEPVDIPASDRLIFRAARGGE